tara:strand:+ start:3297 stop:3572 length:276 start_codon:yes stop_codon:yes gene_type:complete
MSIQTVTIPLGDVESTIEIEVETSDVEYAVQCWLDRNEIRDDVNVESEVTRLLDEYSGQKESGQRTCGIGLSFERAAEHAVRKVFRKFLEV